MNFKIIVKRLVKLNIYIYLLLSSIKCWNNNALKLLFWVQIIKKKNTHTLKDKHHLSNLN